MREKELSVRQKMNRIYDDICGFKIPKDDEAQVKQSKGSPIYGEIKFAALNKLLTYLQLQKNDVFYDLGAGVGKVVLQTALVTNAQRVVGVELSNIRFLASQHALNRAQAFDQKLDTRVKLLNQDLLKADLSDATVIYTCSTAFSLSFFTTAIKHLAGFSHNFRLISLQELEPTKKFRPVETLRLDMTWARNTAVYIYERAV